MLLSFCVIFIQFQPGVAYKSVAYKKSAYEINIFNILCLTFKYKNKACPKAIENLFTLKPKYRYQLKRSWTLLEPFCESKFSQLFINYCGPHVWNIIILVQITDLEQSRTLKCFNEKLKAYLFTLDDVTFLF